jgi:glycoprotein 3-alpha-L-fucosyltransferase
MGAPKEDYLRVAPNNSFIHVDDFASPQALAIYLRYLLKNKTAYGEYFYWKRDGNYEFISTKFWCRLCALLNEPRPKTYDDLGGWWAEEQCVSDQRKKHERSEKQLTMGI